MIQDGKLVCDECHRTITQIATVPESDWRMHNLCSDCFLGLWKRSIPPA